MSVVKWVLIVAALYVAHSYYLTRPANIEKFIVKHNAAIIQDADKACEDYADDVEVSVDFYQSEGRAEIKGGKKELCDYIHLTQTTFQMTQAQSSWRFDDIKVVQDGFPFFGANASYRQTGEVNMGNVAKISLESRERVEIKRTLTGIKFTKVESTGRSKTSML